MVEVSWQESKQFIINHSKQENKRFGAVKLQFHIENYNKNKPVDDVLNIKPYRSNSYGDKRPVRCECDSPEIESLKKRILSFDYEHDDEKQLIGDYIEYVSCRPKTSKLYIGRVPGRVTPLRQAKIIAAIHGNKCVMCGSDRKLEVHHIESLSLNGNRDIENQVPVCHECHCKIHGKGEENV